MQVVWGRVSMVDAEKRLLGNALLDIDNQFFVLLSDRFSTILAKGFLSQFSFSMLISFFFAWQLYSTTYI
jgi:hypothetical protein